MSKALENGVVPNVIQRDGETEVTVDFEYNPAESTELNPSSTSHDDVKKCLQAGTFRTAWGRTIVRGVYYEKQEPAQNVL